MTAGEVFGPYRVELLLGRGGMGEVHRAFDVEYDRMVALKRLAPHLADDSEFQSRFRREARHVAKLRNPHVVPIHKFGEIDGQLFIDMRLVEGVDLAELIRSTGAISPQRAVSIVAQTASALDAAHASGLVHRDVKPSNILIDGTVTDFVYLADFGITRVVSTQRSNSLTRTGVLLGSLNYMAPEQFDGAVSPQSDIYALSCVLFELLTGLKPYHGDGLPALMHSHLSTPPPLPSAKNPELGKAFDDVITKGMAKQAEQRYASAGELAAAAHHALAEFTSQSSCSAEAVGTADRRTERAPEAAVDANEVSREVHAASSRTSRKVDDNDGGVSPAAAAHVDQSELCTGPTETGQQVHLIVAPSPDTGTEPSPRAGRLRSPEALRLTAVLIVVAAMVAGIAVVALLFDSSGATARTRQSETVPGSQTLPTTLSVTTSPPQPLAHREMVFIGRSSGDEVTLAIGIKNGKAAAYLCDGKTIEAWLEGTVSGDEVLLIGARGAVISAKLDEDSALGTVTIAGTVLPYSAQASGPPAGLYESRTTVDDQPTRIGWIVLPDGSQVGIRSDGSRRTPAPHLDGGRLTAVGAGGSALQATAVTGDTKVVLSG